MQHNDFVNQRNGRDANAPSSHIRANPQLEPAVKQQQQKRLCTRMFVEKTRTTHKLAVIRFRIRHKRKCLLQTRRKEARKRKR